MAICSSYSYTKSPPPARQPSPIAAPVRQIFRKQGNAKVLTGDVTAIGKAARTVTLEDGLSPAHSYFGNDAWATHAPGLKILEGAFEICRRILPAFEHTEREQSEQRRKAWLTLPVIDAG